MTKILFTIICISILAIVSWSITEIIMNWLVPEIERHMNKSLTKDLLLWIEEKP